MAEDAFSNMDENPNADPTTSTIPMSASTPPSTRTDVTQHEHTPGLVAWGARILDLQIGTTTMRDRLLKDTQEGGADVALVADNVKTFVRIFAGGKDTMAPHAHEDAVFATTNQASAKLTMFNKTGLGGDGSSATTLLPGAKAGAYCILQPPGTVSIHDSVAQGVHANANVTDSQGQHVHWSEQRNDYTCR